MDLSREIAEATHRANDQLSQGLENCEYKEVKEMYNLLVSLKIQMYEKYIKYYARYMNDFE